MNPRRQLYILAFAAYTTSLVVMAALAWLAIQYNTVAGIVQLTIALSGNGLGGFALVLGLLRDDRAERERRRADEAVEAAKKSEQKANEAQQLIGQLQQQLQQQVQQQAEASQKLVQEFQAQVETERQQAEHERQQAALERQRANRAEAELRRLRDDQRHEARLRRLEEALGLTSETELAVDPPGENQ